MILRTLYLHNFRCYHEAHFEFCEGINKICGANAQGKTTILEAIYFLIAGRSFRAAQTSELIRFGASSFYIEALFTKHGIDQTLKIAYNGKERKIVYNSTVCHSSTELLGLLQGVIISPDDASLVKGGPLLRRHFLDLQLALVDPLYIHHLSRYTRAMRQRNVLLRAKNPVTLHSWEYEMANSAAYLMQQRLEAVNDLQKNSRQLYAELNHESEVLQLNYKTGTPAGLDSSALKKYHLDQFQKLRQREMLLGYTLTGPHKDDLTIAIGTKEARFFASEGQQRSCVTAMRLAEWQRLYTITNELPLMLIDDIGISLDSRRREKIFNHLGTLGQVFVSATDEPETSSYAKEQKTIWCVNS